MKIVAASRGQPSIFKNKIQISKRVSWLLNAKTLLWLIIFLGILLRLNSFLSARSLWLDEAKLALNIVDRSFSGLFEPLNYDQGAPLGFLMIEKLAITIFGNNEYALRLFPFFCGIIALFLFYRVSTYFIGRRMALVALGLFAFSKYLIYYSGEVKQYSSDVAVTLILFLMVIELQTKELTWGRVFLSGLIGGAALWLSHAALFVFAGLIGGLLLCSLWQKDWPHLSRLFIVSIFGAVSFLPLYLISFSKLSNQGALLTYWAENFMPLPLRSYSDIMWFVQTFFDVFENPVGIDLVGVAAFALLMGVWAMALINKKHLLLLTAPLGLTLLASGFHLYPFGDRLILFIVPMVLILIAQGIGQLDVKAGPLVSITLATLIFILPVQEGLYTLVRGSSREEIKPVMAYMQANYQADDTIYLYYGAYEAFKYYQSRYGFEDKRYITGKNYRDQLQHYTEEMDKLRGQKRVWILFSHVYKGFDEKKFFLYYLDSLGHRVDSFEKVGASVYLYDLSPEN